MDKKKSLFLIAMLVLPMLSVFVTPAVAAPSITVWPGTGVAVEEVSNVFFVSGGGYDGGVQLFVFVEDWSMAYFAEPWLMLGSPQDWNMTTQIYAKSTSTGGVPDFSYLIVWGEDLPATTTTLIGVAQSDSNPDREDRAYRNVDLVHIIGDVPYLTMDIPEGKEVNVGDKITIKGENFTPGGQVEIYWNNPDNLIGTTIADDDGNIKVDVIVPESPSGYMALLVYDVEGDILALDHEASPEPHTWFGLEVVASLELDDTSIRGEEEERFNLIGHGFAWLNDEYSNDPDSPTDTAYLPGTVDEDVVEVWGVQTYHDSAEATANGYIEITRVELSEDIETTGWVEVSTYWYTDTHGDYADGYILVSKPPECAEASFDKEGTIEESGNVGDGFTVYVWNFDANSVVYVKFGGVLFETTIHTDSNGAGSAELIVPELPGEYYVYSVDIFCNGEHTYLYYEIEPEVTLDVSGEYVQSGWWVHVIATGLDPDSIYIPTEDDVEIFMAGNTEYELIVGSIVDEDIGEVRPSQLGTLEFRYQSFYDNSTITGLPTEEEVYVDVDGIYDYYLAVQEFEAEVDSPDYPDEILLYEDAFFDTAPVLDPFYATIDVGQKPTFEIYDYLDALVPTWEYQLLVDGRAIKVRPVGKNVFTGKDISSVEPISFRWNVTAPGMHTLELIKKADGLVMWSLDVMVSDVDGPEHMELDTTVITYDSEITAYFWNFDSGEPLTVQFDCLDEYDMDVDDFGARKVILNGEAFPNLALLYEFDLVPMGEYYIMPRGYPELKTIIEVQPSPVPTEIEDLVIDDPLGIDDMFDIDWYNLQSDTRYQLLFDGEVVASETSDEYGYLEFLNVQVPIRVPGTYDLTLKKVLDGSIVQNYGDVVPTAEIINPLYLPPEAFPGQLVDFELPDFGATAGETYHIGIEINGTTFYDAVMPVVSTGLGYDTIIGAFSMPNGDADELLVVKAYVLDTTAVEVVYETSAVAMYRIQGAGALMLGADLANDIAYIKGKVTTIETSLSELDAKVVAISDGIAEIQTTLGTMWAMIQDLNAEVLSISDDVAEVKTDLGTVKAKLSDLASTLASHDEAVLAKLDSISTSITDVATSITTLAGSISGVKSDVAALKGDISDVKSAVDSVSSAVSGLKSDIAGVKSDVATVKADTAGLGNISTFVIIAAILAAITVVLEIVVLARKK